MTGHSNQAFITERPEPQTIRELISCLQAEGKELDAEVSSIAEALATVTRLEDPALAAPPPEEKWLPHSCDALRALHAQNVRSRLALEGIRRRLLL